MGPYPAKAVGFATQGGAGRYGLKPGEVPHGYGTVGLALHTIDRYDGMAAKFGVRRIELFVDSVPVFSTALRRTSTSIQPLLQRPHGLCAVQGQQDGLPPLLPATEQQAEDLRQGGGAGAYRARSGAGTTACASRSRMPMGTYRSSPSCCAGRAAERLRSGPTTPWKAACSATIQRTYLQKRACSLTLPANAPCTTIRMCVMPDGLHRPRPSFPCTCCTIPLTPIHSSSPLRIDLPELTGAIAEQGPDRAGG